MSPDPRVIEAFKVTRGLHIRDEEVKPVLKSLLKLYDRNWELIEEDNYRTLVDAYFESKENKLAVGNDGSEATRKNDASERPGKRLHLAEDSKMDKSSQSLAQSENPSTMVRRQGVMESSQPCLRNGRTGSSSELPLKQFRDRGKDPLPTPHGDRKLHSERAPLSSISHGNHKKDFMKPKTRESTNGVPVSAEPTLMRRPALPGSSGGSTGGRSVKPTASTEVVTSARDALHVTGPKNGALRTQRSQADFNGVGSCSATGTPNLVVQQQPITHKDKKSGNRLPDITKSTEKVKISLVDETGNECLPKFNYIPHNIIYQNANVNISLARIADEDCCSDCSGNCLSSAIPCACAHETGGEFVYTPEGLLKEDFLRACMSMKREPEKHPLVYCQDCPLERFKNEYMPEKCKGHLVRRFIKECWRKCGCDLKCGNRVVQRGISCKLQVFLTREGKGWGVRTLEVLEKGTFVCEYVGEILTNSELYQRNMERNGNERHTYPVNLDGDWGSEKVLEDDNALCLDATFHGNIARFINHRCFDANLVDIPVQVETPDRHYYHLAFFTTRKVNAFEELTWDYGIDFDDVNHPIKAFQCTCGSPYCRTRKQKGKRLMTAFA